MGSRKLHCLLAGLAALIGFGLAVATAQAGLAASQNMIRNPLLPVGAADTDSPDPWVFRHNGKYWINYTSEGKLVYRVADQLGALGSAPERRLWPPVNQPDPADRNSEYWAPETHLVDGRWYVYYTAKASEGGLGQHRMYVLESSSGSPAGPYRFKAEMSVPQPFAIDGTVLRVNGKLFYAYSGGPNFQPTSIYLAELSNPWTIKGTPLLISTPEYGWEKQPLPINEGPEFLVHGNRLHVIFSASHCGFGQYALGRLTVPRNGDLMDPGTWASSKYPDPVFQSSPANGVYGPGHGSFFTTDGGRKFWNVYHATDEPGKGCFTGGLRTTRVQPFTFDGSGNPSFGRPVSVERDIRAPREDRTTAIQAEAMSPSAPARAPKLADRRFFGYAGRTLNPKAGWLPKLRFSLLRKGRYRVFLRVLAQPGAAAITLVRPDGKRIKRRLERSSPRAIELDMGRMMFGAGRQTLRLRAGGPVAFDQIRLQPEPSRKPSRD